MSVPCCLSLGESRIIQTRRKAIIRERKVLTKAHPQPYPGEDPPLVQHPHRRESPSQFRLRMKLLHGDSLLSTLKKWRIKGRWVS